MLGLNSVDFVFRNLRLQGLDPRQKSWYRFILQGIALATIFVFVLVCALEIPLNWKGMETMAKLNMFPLAFMFLVKMICFVVNQHLLQRMVKVEFWPLNKFGPEVEQDLNKKHDIVCKVLIMYISGCTSITIIFSIRPFVSTHRTLMFGGYEICNFDNMACFLPHSIIHNIITFLQLLPVDLLFDSIFVLFVFRAYCAIKLIKKGFKSVDVIDLNLGELVDQHNEVLFFIQDLRNFFRGELLVQFGCSLGSLIFCSYMTTSQGIPPTLPLLSYYGFLYILFALQLILYCVAGTIIMYEIQSIADTVYNLDWYKQSKRRSDLAFIIKRCQYGDKITAGNMFGVNLDSLVLLFRNSFSIYTLLLTLGGTEEAPTT